MALNPTTAFPGKIAAASGPYPYGEARDVTTPGDGTGTPWIETLLNDIFGLQQSLLDEAGITPSGFSDTVGVSQYHDAIRRTAGHPGMVQAMMASSDASTLGIRLLLLDGSSVLVANYPELVAATYVGDTDNAAVGAAEAGFFKSSDAAGLTPNTAGPYFQLPDCRGVVLRGYDPTGVSDPEGVGRYMAELQFDSMEEHSHLVKSTSTSDSYANEANILYTVGATSRDHVQINTPYTGFEGLADTIADAVHSGSRDSFTGAAGRINDDETRMRNQNATFYIWY